MRPIVCGSFITASVAAALIGMTGVAAAAYPFEGSWTRADRSCSATATRERTYMAKEVVSPRGRCTIRKIVTGSGGFELFERCERPNERPSNLSEIIRMTGPDSMVLTRQTARLKLSRGLRFTRCPTSPAAATAPPKPTH